MVVVLIGIIASIAALRMLRVAQSTAEASMSRNVELMQRAIDLYAQEHEGAYPHPDLIEQQLTQFTDTAGSVSTAKQTPYVLGPYLSRIPRVPAGPQKGSSRIAEAPEAGAGWIYAPEKGEIAANTAAIAEAPPADTTVATADSETSDSGGTESESTESDPSLTETATTTIIEPLFGK